jgi:folate-binding protein YgfZ
MKKNQIIILEDRGLISVSGDEAKDFLQNIITNDIEKVNQTRSIFSALFTPQGKYLYEFFIIKSSNGFFLDCDGQITKDLINHLSKYKLRSKVEIDNLSSEYVVGLIDLTKFKEIQFSQNENTETVLYRDCPVFVDPRSNKLGARILSTLEKIHLTIKKLNLQIVDDKIYISIAHLNGIPIKGMNNLKDQLFGLEANFEELNAIDFKKGCYVGQENTARMRLKNKIRKKLKPIKVDCEIKIGDEIKYNDLIIGKILIDKPVPFALIKLFEPEFSLIKDQKLKINNSEVQLI